MKPLIPIRLLITLAATFATAVALVVLLVITDTALSVWQRIEQTPGWFMVVWPLVIVCVAGFVGQHFWARGCFVSTVVRDVQVIRDCIRHQEREYRRAAQLSLM